MLGLREEMYEITDEIHEAILAVETAEDSPRALLVLGQGPAADVADTLQESGVLMGASDSEGVGARSSRGDRARWATLA